MATSLSTPLLQPSDPVSPRTQQRLAHVAERRDNLAKVLDVDDVRGVPLTELLARRRGGRSGGARGPRRNFREVALRQGAGLFRQPLLALGSLG